MPDKIRNDLYLFQLYTDDPLLGQGASKKTSV